MSADLRCPKCSSENVVFSKKRSVSVCEDCGHEFAQETLIVSMRIFLSYGHDANEELVRCIYADLKKRGHDVWFDKAEIKFGEEWRRAITDGILQSHRVLSFLSKHSSRDPGVCLDEIAIAIGVKGGNVQTILIESEQEVQPPVNIGHIQWLDMHDWKERRDCGSGLRPEDRAAREAAWEQWYRAKLAEIVRVVESDESRRFAGEIETLNGHLKPIKSDARIGQLMSKGFFGRQWLFEAVEQWRQAPKHDSRLFWIMGAPGVGKSAFAAQLTHTRGDTVIAAQFCEWDKPDHRDARRVVRSLAFQLATRLPDYRKLLLTLPEIADLDRKDAAELFDYLLANPLKTAIGGGRERRLIVLDALDEAGESGRNPLVEMLARNAQRLPDWLGLVVTSRPEFDVKTPLQALNPFPLDAQSESNRADLRDYVQRNLAPQLAGHPDADRLVDQILEKSEGVFLYVEHFCDDIRQGHLSLDSREQFPQGLGGIYCQYFQRQFPDLKKFRREIRPALRVILAAREPITLDVLGQLNHWQQEELHDIVRSLGAMFPTGVDGIAEVIRPCHRSIADWLTDADKAGPYHTSVEIGHRQLAEHLWAEYCRGKKFMGLYGRRHLSDHLVAAGRWNDLATLLKSRNFFHDQWDDRISCVRSALSALSAEQGANLGSSIDPSIDALRRELDGLKALAGRVGQPQRLVTVLFADIVGFTVLAQVISSVELSKLVIALWEKIDSIIVAHRGQIVLHVGDGVMAVWETDDAHDCGVHDAIRSAQGIQIAAASFSRDRGREIKMRIGLDTGGAEARLSTTSDDNALSEIQGAAAKLVRAAAPGAILVSHATYEQVIGNFRFCEHPVPVRTGANSVRSYTLLGATENSRPNSQQSSVSS